MVGGDNVCGDWGVLALVLDFREVMLTSPPELAHCGGPPSESVQKSTLLKLLKLLKLLLPQVSFCVH